MAWVPSKAISESGGGATVLTHPFKVFLKQEQQTGSDVIFYYYSVAYHSQLFSNEFENNTTYFSYKKIPITGLDFYEIIPDPTLKNVYITLDVTVSDLVPTSAEINYHVEGDEGFAPFSFTTNYEQNFAQVVLAVIVNDSESVAGEYLYSSLSSTTSSHILGYFPVVLIGVSFKRLNNNSVLSCELFGLNVGQSISCLNSLIIRL